jgi:hypothetical protein
MNFDEIAETALVEESAIVSKQDRYRSEGGKFNKCSSCGKVGDVSSKCYARERKEVRMNPVMVKRTEGTKSFTCFRCGKKGTWPETVRSPEARGESQ